MYESIHVILFALVFYAVLTVVQPSEDEAISVILHVLLFKWLKFNFKAIAKCKKELIDN